MTKALLALLLASAASGCAAVKPWQREALAQPGMQLSSTADVRAEQHMLESREAAVGGFGGGGGGCGCN